MVKSAGVLSCIAPFPFALQVPQPGQLHARPGPRGSRAAPGGGFQARAARRSAAGTSGDCCRPRRGGCAASCAGLAVTFHAPELRGCQPCCCSSCCAACRCTLSCTVLYPRESAQPSPHYTFLDTATQCITTIHPLLGITCLAPAYPPRRRQAVSAVAERFPAPRRPGTGQDE